MGEIEKYLQQILSQVGEIKSDVSELKQDVNSLKKRMDRMEQKVDSIFEETNGLLEFQNGNRIPFKEENEIIRAIYEMLGEHDISIRALRKRKTV